MPEREKACEKYAVSAYAYLDSIVRTEERIRRMEEKVARWRELAERATGSTEAVRVSGTHGSSRVAENIDKCIDATRGIEDVAQWLEARYAKALRMIAEVSSPEAREIVELRRLQRMSWEEIAKRMAYDNSQVRRLDKQAMREIQGALDDAGITD